ncbi:hypothetical protein V6N11_026299 [Hibiscus sabdariffa]|uniref:Uncharacterized protein n=1 Tax=Hibiscus sabdariffa TaxID=183260 RepID=A0ABR2SVB0_9ROSI
MIHDQLEVPGSQQTTSTSSVFYAKLWQSNIPSKVKITLWRFVRNYLPTRSNLYTRYLLVDSLCPLCQQQPETVVHLCLQCNITTQILLAFHITIPAWFPNMDWLTWLGSCVSSLSNTDCVLFFITMWAVWGVRNKLIHKSISPDIAMVVSFIKNYVAEFEASQVVSYKPSLSSSSRWLPPSGNLIKVNFDTVFDSHMLSSSSGIVFRNHEGLLLAVAVYPHSHIPNPCVAEAQACLDAISLAKDLFFCNIIIEGDSLTVINKLQSGSNDMSLIGMILSDVKSLSKFFEGVTFNFVSRACNEVAHKTALLDRNSASFLVWVEEAPTVIEAAAEKDQRWVDPPD